MTDFWENIPDSAVRSRVIALTLAHDDIWNCGLGCRLLNDLPESPIREYQEPWVGYLAVSYMRPFLKTRKQGHPLISQAWFPTTANSALHDQIADYRNNLVAHNGSDLKRVTVQHHQGQSPLFGINQPLVSNLIAMGFQQHCDALAVEISTALDVLSPRYWALFPVPMDGQQHLL